MQAKRDSSLTVSLANSNDLVQLYLYTNRPTFDVKRRDAPKSICFPKVVPHTTLPDTALNYGITPPTHIQTKAAPVAWGHDRWKLANNLNGHAGTIVTATVPLQDVLVDFLEGSAGFDFSLSSPGESWTVLDTVGDKWSALINFILQDAVNVKPPRYARTFLGRRTDGERDLSFAKWDSHGMPHITVSRHFPDSVWKSSPYGRSWIKQVLERSRLNSEPPNNDPPRDDGERDDDQWGGMSVVLMEVSARND